jgi:Big-like domain-containing protein
LDQGIEKMRKLSYFTTLFAMLLVAACGDSGQGFVGNGGGTGGSPGGSIVVSAVNVLASSPSLPSDAGQSLDVTVVVRDQNNVAVGGVTVVMSSDSGILTIVDPITDANGVVKAQINAGGDPTNRTITISADANGVVGSVAINVLGTTLSLSGASALAQGDSAPYTIVLTDAGGNGISGQTVDISSAAGNTLAASSLTTDVGGQAQVVLTASTAGTDTLTATALGISATQDLSVSDDSFSITAPLSGDEVILNTLIAVDLTWSIGGVPQAGQPISFSATRGTLSSFSATTNGAGVASVTITSNNAGASAITATNSSGTTTGVQIEFVANVPDSISIQASPFTIGPGEQSAITAIVRDAANNLVKNEVVVFVLDDVTGGQLSVAQAVTDSQGRAQTFYTASSTTSANNGVTVTAAVQANNTISSSVNLTVAQRELFISIGTGNSIFEPNTAQYRVEFVVQVSDSQGNGVAGVNVQVGILSDAYFKGFWTYDQLSSAWVQILRAGPCADEDINRNGVLDLGEDFNNSGRIEAGNIAAAVPQSGSNGSFVTDNGGFGIVDVFFAQDHARWVAVTIEATTSVQGTEFAKASSFILPINGEDVNDQNQVPPGVNSPFGVSTNCGDLL